MALTVIGGSNFLGRYLISSLGAKYGEVRIGDMYPFRQGVYRLQEQLEGVKIVKHALSYPTSLKLAMTDAAHVVVVTHDYFKLAHSKNFFLERVAFLAKELGTKRLTIVAPIELIQLNPLDGDPFKLVSESEQKAKLLFPSLSILRTNLVFGQSCTSLILQHALHSLSSHKSPVYGRNGLAKFQPVHESELLEAVVGLNPGEEVSLAGPEVLSWGEMVTILKKHTNSTNTSVGGVSEAIADAIATNPHFGDLLYPSHLQQFYRLLSLDWDTAPTKTGNRKFAEEYKPGEGKGTEGKAWHRVILD